MKVEIDVTEEDLLYLKNGGGKSDIDARIITTYEAQKEKNFNEGDFFIAINQPFVFRFSHWNGKTDEYIDLSGNAHNINHCRKLPELLQAALKKEFL